VGGLFEMSHGWYLVFLKVTPCYLLLVSGQSGDELGMLL
jgi:hypothetical protein